MTDDFQLFQDQASGDDADIALVTAYLARELSVVQIVAVAASNGAGLGLLYDGVLASVR